MFQHKGAAFYFMFILLVAKLNINLLFIYMKKSEVVFFTFLITFFELNFMIFRHVSVIENIINH